jgi:hypothetical protein
VLVRKERDESLTVLDMPTDAAVWHVRTQKMEGAEPDPEEHPRVILLWLNASADSSVPRVPVRLETALLGGTLTARLVAYEEARPDTGIASGP